MVHNVKSRTGVLVTILAALLVPVAVLGVLTWALGNPAEKTSTVKAAVVNNDEPVKLNGTLAPLGRQLTAKLAGDDIPGNYTWEVATADSAEEGMRDGSYVATVVIPKDFSRAATSYAKDPNKAEQARIEVSTSDRGNRVDEAVSKQVTATAARLLGSELSEKYLDNIYLGFNRLHDQLGKAGGGVDSLGGGARKLADGTGELSGAAGKLAGGNQELASGLGGLDSGAGQLSSGASGLAGGLTKLRDSTTEIPGQLGTLSTVAGKQADGVRQLGTGIGALADGLEKTAQQCPPIAAQLCDAIRAQAEAARKLDTGAGKLNAASTGVSTGLRALNGETPGSAGGLPALVGGIDRLADGATKLSSGAQQLQGGVSKTQSGADRLAGGAQALAGGTGRLTDGADKLAGGTEKLSGGLEQAVRKLPNYTKAERGKLSTVVAAPVQANVAEPTGPAGGLGLGAGAIAVYAVLALWLGAIGTFLVVRATPKRLLESTRPTVLLALRGMRLPLLLAVLQAAAVTVLLGVSLGLSTAEWFGCAGLVLLIALAATALNQALVAALPTLGRFVALLAGLLLLATGFTATAPTVLTDVLGVLPVGAAAGGLRIFLGGDGSVAGSVTALAIWMVAGLLVSLLAVQRRRVVRRDELLAPSGIGARRLRFA